MDATVVAGDRNCYEEEMNPDILSTLNTHNFYIELKCIIIMLESNTQVTKASRRLSVICSVLQHIRSVLRVAKLLIGETLSWKALTRCMRRRKKWEGGKGDVPRGCSAWLYCDRGGYSNCESRLI